MIALLSVLLHGAFVLTAPPSVPASDPPRLADVRPVALLASPARRVRTTDPYVQRLLEQGVRHSRTFSALIAELNTSDVIVYIERVNLRNAVAGQMLLAHVAGDTRYLRIQIAPIGHPKEEIATIGHELRHALEVAASRDVRDQSGLQRLYQEIGRPSIGAHSYETRAAQMTGREVRLELGS